MSWSKFLNPVVPAALALTLTLACEVPDNAFVREMSYPVKGDFGFTNTFGAPRSGGRSHAGQDIMADQMTPIVAPEAGTVTWFVHGGGGSSGNALGIKTEDGWTYKFMHLNNDTPNTDDGKNTLKHAFGPDIELGATVKRGQVLGYVGDSGNAEATSHHLHFEMINPKGVAIDSGWSLVVAAGSPYEGQFDR